MKDTVFEDSRLNAATAYGIPCLTQELNSWVLYPLSNKQVQKEEHFGVVGAININLENEKMISIH